MKKVFLALLSIATLAIVSCKPITPTPENPDQPTEQVSAPTAADLADYIEEGKYVVAVQFKAQVCNDVVWAGSYNEWSTAVEDMLKMEPLAGFEGWYVVAVPSLLNEDGTFNNAGKPIQLASDGSFSWDYQTGDAASWTLVSGTVTIEDGYAGESNLTNYDPAEPIVLISEYFKNNNNPCVEVSSVEYTIFVKVPAGDYIPHIIGDFNGWAEGIAMELQADGSYKYILNDTPSHSFKLKGDATTWDNEIQKLGTNAETGEAEWQNLPNYVLGEETTIVLDYSGADYKWTLTVVE